MDTYSKGKMVVLYITVGLFWKECKTSKTNHKMGEFTLQCFSISSKFPRILSNRFHKLQYKKAWAAVHGLLHCLFHLAPFESWWFGMFWSKCAYVNRIKTNTTILGCEVVWWKILQRQRECSPVCIELFVLFAWPEAPNPNSLLRGPDTNLRAIVNTSNASSILKHGKSQHSWNQIPLFCWFPCFFTLFPLTSRTSSKCSLFLHIPEQYELWYYFSHTSAIQKRG